MMKKKSRKELAREIIANLRRGMGRPPLTEAVHKVRPVATGFMSMPLGRAEQTGGLQTSHS
jgi:hypothetical protein